MFTITINIRTTLAIGLLAGLSLLFADPVAVSAQTTQPDVPDGVQLMRDIPYKEVRSRPLALDLYLPENSPEAALPLIVYVHGGGYRKGEKEELLEIAFYRDVLLELVRDQKAVVASIDFSKGSRKAPISLILQDCVDAVNWLRDHAGEHNIDPQRIGLVGNNSGGYLALMTGLTGPEVAFIFANAPPTDFKRAYEALSADDDPEAKKLLNQMEIGFEGTLKESADNYVKLSPVNNISPQAPPILLFVGRDEKIKDHSVWLKKAAEAAGADVRLTVIDNADQPFYEEDQNISPALPELRDSLRGFILEHL